MKLTKIFAISLTTLGLLIIGGTGLLPPFPGNYKDIALAADTTEKIPTALTLHLQGDDPIPLPTTTITYANGQTTWNNVFSSGKLQV